jgi:hypothetical protein
MAGASANSRREKVARLAALVESAGLGGLREAPERFSCGSPALDAGLPGGGPVRGSLLEWLSGESRGGATLLAVIAAREAQRDGGAVVVIDREQGFYPPAAVAWGLDLASLIVVRPQNEADERWALDQALRCEHAAAVLAWPRRLDGHTFRRLQLAAEASGAVGLLVRPPTARREPSWAHVRWAVTPRPTPAGVGERWQLSVRLLRVRGGPVAEAPNDQPKRVPLLARPAVSGVYQLRTAGQASSGTLTAFCERAETVLEIDPVSGAIHEARVGHLAAQLAGAARDAGPA